MLYCNLNEANLVYKTFLFQGDIECYYDTDSQVIYLHYQSLFDTSRLANKCKQLVDKSMVCLFT